MYPTIRLGLGQSRLPATTLLSPSTFPAVAHRRGGERLAITHRPRRDFQSAAVGSRNRVLLAKGVQH